MTIENLSTSEISDIKALQRLAYDCAEEVAGGLQAGATEQEAAARLGVALRERGVDGFFHVPFAWFGDRAGFQGFRAPSWRTPFDNIRFARQFFPTARRLEPGMIGILDVAPIRRGLCADIGYAFALGASSRLPAAMHLLRELRKQILAEVRRERTMRQVYLSVEAAAHEAGYECAHALYPSRVLGHKIGRIPLPTARSRAVAGFDLRTYLYFGQQLLPALPGISRVPLWNASRLADVRPEPGLWAIEPHLRRDDLGAKWEEILVVTDSDAHWLDDELPHMTDRRAPAAAATA